MAGTGRYLGLSLPRRIVNDMLYAGRQLTLTTIEKRMRLADVVAARSTAQPRPSWCALFTKAVAAVAARHPELRRVYVPFPWPRLFEFHQNVAGIVVERTWHDESSLFLARVRAPEQMGIVELDACIRRFKDKPIAEISGFRGALRLARLPHLARRALWWMVMNVFPRVRGKFMGTFGVSVTAGMGATGLFVIAPWTYTLHYDVFAADGSLDVRLTFDHRVLDGAILAMALREVEEELCGAIRSELLGLRSAAA